MSLYLQLAKMAFLMFHACCVSQVSAKPYLFCKDKAEMGFFAHFQVTDSEISA